MQPASRRHQREAALVLGEVQAEVAPQEERPQELVLRAVGPVGESSSAFTHTLTHTHD